MLAHTGGHGPDGGDGVVDEVQLLQRRKPGKPEHLYTHTPTTKQGTMQRAERETTDAPPQKKAV